MAKNMTMLNRYREDVVPTLMEEFSYQNIMEVPSIKKIVVNIGVGEAVDNPKSLDGAVEDLRIITGQQPMVTRARKSIANFKLREGRSIGAKVTLRGERMWALLDRLVEAGHTVLVIEHNLDVIKTADWVLDMGPEAGDRGGRLVVAGPPEVVASHPDSLTAPFLREVLEGAGVG